MWGITKCNEVGIIVFGSGSVVLEIRTKNVTGGLGRRRKCERE